jgi:hypothetical protein
MEEEEYNPIEKPFTDLSVDERKLYSEIEYLIIMWRNDGNKTAGSLTRQIMHLLD